MEKMITVPLWQLEDIENTLRMCYNALDSHTKKTCLDRCVCKSWEFAKSALAKPTIETPINAPLVDVSKSVDSAKATVCNPPNITYCKKSIYKDYDCKQCKWLQTGC